MVRLSKQQISAKTKSLARWQTPDDMARLVDDVMNMAGSEDLFNQSGLAFLREAWVAAKFGRLRHAKHVRLITDVWPDFELRKDGRVEQFEVVEADDPNRRRGEEYRSGIGEIEEDPVEDWIARAEAAPVWLAAACQKKADKRYAGSVNLVVHLNLDEFGVRQTEVENCFSSATEPVKDSFDFVWVLWKEKIYLIWKCDS